MNRYDVRMRVVENPRMNAFEEALLKALLDGELEALRALRAQARSARVVSRELSGAGFFLNFEVPPTERRVEPPNFEITDVYFDLKGTECGGGSVLFVRDGKMKILEAFSHGSGWPDEPTEFKLFYFDGEKRNLAKVAGEIQSRAALSRKPQD